MLLHYLVKHWCQQNKPSTTNYKVVVATYLRCGGVVNNQSKKGLLLSVWVKFLFKSVNIWKSYKQERGCLMHFARLANTLLKKKKSVRDMLLLFNINLTANLARNLSVNFFNRLRFDRIMVTSLWPRFFGPPCKWVRIGEISAR